MKLINWIRSKFIWHGKRENGGVWIDYGVGVFVFYRDTPRNQEK